MESFIKLLLGLIGWLGSIGLTIVFIAYMIKKQGWKLAQITMGVVFGLMLAASNPQLPTSVHNGIQNIINSVSK